MGTGRIAAFVALIIGECVFLLTFPSCLLCTLVKQPCRWCWSLVISVRVHEQARCLTT